MNARVILIRVGVSHSISGVSCLWQLIPVAHRSLVATPISPPNWDSCSRPPGDNTGGLYTGKRIAERANSLGYSLSDAYISQLRTGKARTPSFRTVEAIARAFGVSVTFFLTDPDEDSDRAQRQQDYVDLVAQTRSQLAGVDVSKLCPDTIDVMIDVLRMIKSEVAARSTDT